MITAQGNLALIGTETSNPRCHWKGQEIPGVLEIKIDWEPDERRVKLKVRQTTDDVARQLYAELRSAGITVKEER